MIIKSISKITVPEQLPAGYFIGENREKAVIKRQEEHILAGKDTKSSAHHKNIMRSDEEYTGLGRNVWVLGSNIQRKEVLSICFRDKLPEDLSEFERYWDVSEKGDKSVMAYAERFGSSYAISICGEGGVTAPVSCKCLFADYYNLRSICFYDAFDTSRVTNMHSMFYGCGNLADLDVSRFDTSNVINMGNMFYGCESLESLNVSGFDTSNVTDMRGMFSWCAGLRRLDVSGFDTSKVINTNGMFKGCGGLARFDASRFGKKR